MRAFSRNESGAVAIITGILMVVLLGFLALAVDIGHLATVKNELQNAADAAALSGARALVFKGGAMVQKITPVPDPPYCAQAINWAQNTINKSDAQNLTITSVQTGVWDWPNNTFTPSAICQAGVNAVHVVVERNAASNWPVATWFARIFGVDTVNAGAQATAACGYLNEYCDWAPIALTDSFYDSFPHESQLDPSYTPQNTIMFYPDEGDNGGWCLTTQNPTPPTLTNAIENPASNGCLSLNGTSTVYLNNGNLIPGIRAVQQAIANSGDSYTPPPYGDPYEYNPDDPLNSTGTDPCWNVIVPVVHKDMTDQLNQQATVDRFALLRITGAYTPNDPDNPTYNDSPPRFVITFYLLNDNYQLPGTSGGVVSNLFATQPALVQ